MAAERDLLRPFLLLRSVRRRRLFGDDVLSLRFVAQRFLHSSLQRPNDYFFQASSVGSPEAFDESSSLDEGEDEVSWEDISFAPRRKKFSEIRSDSAAEKSMAGSERSYQTSLILDQVLESSTNDQLAAYLSAVGMERRAEDCLPTALGVDFASLAKKVRLFHRAGLSEFHACQLAMSLSTVQIPEDCLDCLLVLKRQGVSFTELAARDQKGSLALLSIRPSQVERKRAADTMLMQLFRTPKY